MESEARIYEKLEELGKTVHDTLVAVTEIKGDSKLQSQVLQFHIDQLKEFKADYKTIIENQDKKFEALAARVDKIEKWQIRVIAMAAGAAAILSVLLQDIKEAFLG